MANAPTEKQQLKRFISAMEVLASPEPLTHKNGKGALSYKNELKARTEFAYQVLTETFNDGA